MGKIDHKTMCILCQTLPLSKAHTPKHAYMERITKTEDYGDQGAQSLFRCSVCQTHWLYQQDKWKSCLGFKLWTGSVEDYLTSTKGLVNTWGSTQAPRTSPTSLDTRPLH